MFCSGQNSSITKGNNFLIMQKRVMIFVHCTSLHRDLSTSEVNLIVSVLCSGQYISKFSETTGPTEVFHMAPPWDRGKDRKLI